MSTRRRSRLRNAGRFSRQPYRSGTTSPAPLRRRRLPLTVPGPRRARRPRTVPNGTVLEEGLWPLAGHMGAFVIRTQAIRQMERNAAPGGTLLGPGGRSLLWGLMNEFWAGFLSLVVTPDIPDGWRQRRRPVGVGTADVYRLQVHALSRPAGAPGAAPRGPGSSWPRPGWRGCGGTMPLKRTGCGGGSDPTGRWRSCRRRGSSATR
jgi:hypothetical protein